MAFIDDVLGGLVLEPIHNLSFLSQKMLDISNAAPTPAVEPYKMLLGLLGNSLETYQISQEAGTDKLTGALNRKYLDITLERAFNRAKKTGDALSVIIADLDFFKQVNDSYGHLKGDEVLRETARIISETIRGYGILGRYGGEEFMALLQGSSAGQTMVLAERIRTAVYGADILNGRRDITLSLGAATFPQHANTIKTLVGKADKSLYMAKQTGSNRSVIWRDDFESETQAKTITLEMLTGDATKDAPRVKALLELLELANSDETRAEKLDKSFDKILDTIGAETVTLFTVKNGEPDNAYAVSRRNISTLYNHELIKRVMLSGNSVLQVDWDNETTDVSGLSDWQSLAVVPATRNGELLGVLYITVSVKEKELSLDEAGFICNAATLLAAFV
jgi:diguanylate cyclase (GGDEF)-like protein